ncbi:MAG: FAD-dependent oxidoreductase [Moraxellaceae bacterium]|nr:FAD-dependent oxidoreductase [Pseudobdellovibrionaceae bacterium]
MTNIKPRIHIVGAGFSGLSVAYLLSQYKMFDITVYEKNLQIGGMLKSLTKEGLLIESGANSILCTDETLQFLKEIGVQCVFPLKTAKRRYFFRNRVTRWPLSLIETIAFIPRVIFHLVTRKSFIKFTPKQTVAEWAQKYFGFAFTKYLLSPALQGIYAVPAQHLNAENIFGHLLKPKSEKYKGIVSGKTGMGEIIKCLEQKCLSQDVKILTGEIYDFSLPHDIVIVATSAQDAARTVMLQNKFLGAELEKIKMNHVVSVTCQVDDTTRPRGFGCLIPETAETRCLGVLFNSDIFENRIQSNASNETYIFSNQEAENINQLKSDQLKNYMEKTREIIFKTRTPIENIYKSYWPDGLPIYDHVLAHFQNQFVTPKNNIYLHGNYVAGIGLSKIIKNSYDISNQIKKAYS